MKLVVVESPAKAKTIKKYLGNGYKVTASMGHVVDLPKKELGVDPEHNYKTKYVVTNRKALTRLKNDFKGVSGLIIASDLDREGEAIGWHIAQRLGVITPGGHLKDENISLDRIVFTSITKGEIQKAIESPKKLNMDLVNAQQARRILDRLVGYTLSPLLWKKIRFGLSAGRVQSVAVRLVVDREEERNKFKPEEYWQVFSDLSIKKSQKRAEKIVLGSEEKLPEFGGIKFELVKISAKGGPASGRKSKKLKVKKEKDSKDIINEVFGKRWIVSDVSVKASKRNPSPPFITSTLQRTASNLFGYPAKKTMQIAQKLYEAGHITYMRTDSFNIVEQKLANIRTYIETSYGKEYLNPATLRYRTKASTAQEAHEAIRPSHIKKSSEDLGLSGEQKKLYDLIRNRTLASQMMPAKLENTKIYVDIGGYLFEAFGQRIVFDGYLKVYPEKLAENVLPKISVGQELFLLKLIGKQNFTSPPPRYSEASLIKMLEKYGIGRPSTYAPIISTILARKYVIKEAKYFIPTDTGIVVTKLLKKYFPKIVDTGFTAEMEEDLDKISVGKEKLEPVIDEFYKPLHKDIVSGEKNIGRDEFTVLGKSTFKCPECGKSMVKKLGRFGPFLSCSNFPNCKGMRDIEGKTEQQREKEIQKETVSGEFTSKYLPAPEASDGILMILKAGRYGKFWAHPNYPKVKEAKPLMLKEKCPECKRPLVERKGKWGRTFIGCSGYPDCRYIQKTEKLKTKGKK